MFEWPPGWLDIDPTIAVASSGNYAAVPQPQPSAAVRATVVETLAPGVEYYAQLGPLSSVPTIVQPRPYVFETVEVVRWPEWIVNAEPARGLRALLPGARDELHLASVRGRVMAERLQMAAATIGLVAIVMFTAWWATR